MLSGVVRKAGEYVKKTQRSAGVFGLAKYN